MNDVIGSHDHAAQGPFRMNFSATHNVTLSDMAHAARLAARWRDILVNLAGIAVMLFILAQVGFAFAFYVRAVVDNPDMLAKLLRFETGTELGWWTWASVLVTLLLPVFLFYSVRLVVETLFPAQRVRRLMKGSDMLGPTDYLVGDEGVRSRTGGGPDVFLPWTAFDSMRHDATMAVLTRQGQLRFFLPLDAFGADRDAVLATLSQRVS